MMGGLCQSPIGRTRVPGRSGMSMEAGRRVAPAALCLLLLAAPAAADDDGWLTNYDQLHQVTRQAVGDLLEDFTLAGDQSVRIAFESPHETTWIV